MSSDSSAPERFGSRRKGWEPRIYELFNSSTQNFGSVGKRGGAEEDEGQCAFTIKILTSAGHWWETKAAWCMGLNIFSFLLTQICCRKFHPRILLHLWVWQKTITIPVPYPVRFLIVSKRLWRRMSSMKMRRCLMKQRQQPLKAHLFLHNVNPWAAHEKSHYVTENSL